MTGIGELASLLSGANSFFQVKDRVVDKLDRSDPEDLVEENEDLIVVESGGKRYAGDITNLDQNTAEQIVSLFEDHPEDFNLTIFTEEFADEARDYQETFDKGLEKVENLIQYCGSEKRSVINLAKQVNNHYENDRHEQAVHIKNDISTMYGKEGVKLCNLFTSGYIGNAAEHFDNIVSEEADYKDKQELARELMADVMNSAETIYFVSNSDSSEELAKDIKRDIDNQESYIAVHSAGKSNVGTAKQVLNEIQPIAVDNDYNVKSGKPDTSSSAPHLRIIMSLQENRLIE